MKGQKGDRKGFPGRLNWQQGLLVGGKTSKDVVDDTCDKLTTERGKVGPLFDDTSRSGALEWV